MMSKIFRRDSLVENVTVKKKKEKNRVRNSYVNFRVTPEQRKIIEQRIALCGMKKQDFYTESLIHQKITAVGNVKTFDEMRRQIRTIDRHLASVERTDQLDLEVLEALRTILEILDGWEEREGE